MSRSFRTEPKWRIAERNAPRDSEGRILLPRIVERPPRVGDVHPLPKWKLTKLLSRLPPELYHGIRLIELRPRQQEVGEPFATYKTRARAIWLYSLPLRMHLPGISGLQRKLLDASEAEVRETPDGFSVKWDDPLLMGFWFYYDVFVHELGHHHRFYYRSQTGRRGRRSDEEWMADKYCYWVACGRFSPKKYQRRMSKAKASLVAAGSRSS